jgi:lysophospholipase L1-like esterase
MLKTFRIICLITVSAICCTINSAVAQDFKKWEPTIEGFEKTDKQHPVTRGKYIVFTGSSSIVGWKSLNADFPDKNILNRAFGGSQTFEVVHFADRIIKPYKPKQVVIYSGDNDIAAGKTPEEVLNDFKILFSKIKQANRRAVVTFISIKPSPSRKQFMPAIVKTNKLISDFLAEKNRTSFVDIYNPMLTADGKPRPELFKSDSLHMVQAGYDLWRGILKPYLK